MFFKLWCCDTECVGWPCNRDTPVLLEGNLIFLDAEAFRGNDIDKVEKLVNAYDFRCDLMVTGRGNWFMPYWVVRATIARQHNSWRLNTKNEKYVLFKVNIENIFNAGQKLSKIKQTFVWSQKSFHSVSMKRSSCQFTKTFSDIEVTQWTYFK